MYQNVLTYPCRVRSRSSLYNDQAVVAGRLYMKIGSTWYLITTRTYNPARISSTYRYIEVTSDCLHPGPPYRSGGPFHSVKITDSQARELTNQGSYISANTVGYPAKYEGGFYCGAVPDAYHICSPSRMEDLADFGDGTSYGPTAWNRFKPGKPTADLGVFLGEIREVPRMLSTTAAGFAGLWKSMGGHRSSFTPKSVANHWLNHQFGWLPFVNDVRKFYRTYRNLDRHLQHLIRNNGRWVRRGGVVDSESSSEVVGGSETATAHLPGLSSAFFPDGIGATTGSHTRSIIESVQAWFRACFRYYIPDVGSVTWRRNAVRKLFGGSITPSLLWELTPWSWLVDWFTNVGDVIANMDTGLADNLAAKYAYVMCTRRSTYQVQSTLDMNCGSLQNTWSFSNVGKSRVGAHPFGVDLTIGDISLRQWSILSALGITRSSYR
jgi:hypothetical protein